MKKAMTLLALVSAGCVASAQEQIPINNPSFETPLGGVNPGSIQGWVGSGPNLGTWDPSDYSFTGLSAPSGTQIAYIDGGGTYTTISQTLSTTLQPDSIYNLSFEVAGRVDESNPGTDYTLSLYAGGNLLVSATPVAPLIGSWTTVDATYTSGNVTPGENLEIVIGTSATELDFDNVQLTDPPVPDAGNVTWLAGLALLGFARFARSKSAKTN